MVRRIILIAALAGFWLASAPAAGADGAAAIVEEDAPSAGGTETPPPQTGTNGDIYYFYHGYDYGTESLINPLQLIINGGYGITQISSRDNRIWDIDYSQGIRNVWKNVRDPFGSIGNEGWWSFVRSEILPFSTNTDNAQYWPNYTQHLIGGGMSWRMQSEWFRYHGVEHHKRWATATIGFYHFLNEVVENDGKDGWRTDPVADLYIFDPLSIWLFNKDSVARFFSETLHMTDWSYQPMYDPENRTLQNNGQNFAMKWNIPGSEHWSLFYHYGTHGEGGLSYTFGDGHCISAGGGFKADTLTELTDSKDSVTLATSGGFFYDRNGSLLASVLLANSKDYALRVNLYPGLIRPLGLKPGLFMAVNRDDHMLWGVSLADIGLPFGIGGGGENISDEKN